RPAGVSHKPLHRLSYGFDRGGKFAVLALKFWGLAGAIGDDQRRLQSVEMPYRAQRRDRRVVELDIVAARRQPYWRQIIHAANAHGAFDDFRRPAEIARPVRRQSDRGEVAARGLTTDRELVRIAAEMRGIVVY